MVDTLRILVSWQCNLKCSYCCNEQPQFRKDIHPTTLDAIPWNQYMNFCISGGEPLLNFPIVKKVCERIPADRLKILYTNGFLLGQTVAWKLTDMGITAVNVGLHNPETFGRLIRDVTKATQDTRLSVRFHAQDIYAYDLKRNYPTTSFRYWKMNDCDRGNEHRCVLT